MTGPLVVLGERALQGDVAPLYVELPEYELPLGDFDTNPAIDWLTPDAKVNCSRSSTFVLPLALHGSFLTRNSSSAIQPPPTRTITVLRRIRTNLNF